MYPSKPSAILLTRTRLVSVSFSPSDSTRLTVMASSISQLIQCKDIMRRVTEAIICTQADGSPATLRSLIVLLSVSSSPLESAMSPTTSQLVQVKMSCETELESHFLFPSSRRLEGLSSLTFLVCVFPSVHLILRALQGPPHPPKNWSTPR